MDVDALLDRCRRGDPLAWEALVRAYQGRVFAAALHYLRDREEARDVAQDVFVQLYRQLGTLRGDQAFLPWLLRLVRSRAIDRLRRLRSRTPAVAVPVEETPELDGGGATPEESSLEAARRTLLYRALAGLSEVSREMILLKEIQELPLAEISTLLALPLGTVKSRSHRARLELAAALLELDPSYGE